MHLLREFVGVPQGVKFVVDLRAELPSLDVPTLVIGAKHDRLIAPGTTRELADLIPGARWAVETAEEGDETEAARRQHAAQYGWDQPVTALREWIRQVSGVSDER